MIKEFGFHIPLIILRNIITKVNIPYRLSFVLSGPVSMAPGSKNKNIKVVTCLFNGLIGFKRSIKIFCIKQSSYSHYRWLNIIQMLDHSSRLPKFIIVWMVFKLLPKNIVFPIVFVKIAQWPYIQKELVLILSSQFGKLIPGLFSGTILIIPKQCSCSPVT